MSEQMLDLKALSNRADPRILRSKRDKQGQRSRIDSTFKYYWPAVLLALIIQVYYARIEWYSLLILPLLYFIRRHTLKDRDVYRLTEAGISIPYTWLRRAFIPLTAVVTVEFVDLKSMNENDLPSLAIILDTELKKFNRSGMNDSAIYLSEYEFDKSDLEQFAEELEGLKNSKAIIPNTRAERLNRLVTLSWNSRWSRFALLFTDSFSQLLFFYSLIFLALHAFFALSFDFISFIILIVIVLTIIMVQLGDLPSSIIGIRANELEPLYYDMEKIVSTVKIMVMCYPRPIKIVNCAMLYQTESLQQIERVKSIEPRTINPGELTHVEIEVVGNHSKSHGCVVRFQQNGDDTVFEKNLYWN
ncbi:MAG: hypothetical protein INQ03_04700 [Candidatus Heimdallarchaeota archaeon]|nr:hypothetical protein [Candidatus Heimdallarchaeota archaeon]